MRQLIASFLAGLAVAWMVAGWYRDSLDLVAAKAATSATEAGWKREDAQAGILALELTRLSANERTIIREKVKVVESPVYRNVCLDDAGLRLANAAKNGPGVAETAVPRRD